MKSHTCIMLLEKINKLIKTLALAVSFQAISRAEERTNFTMNMQSTKSNEKEKVLLAQSCLTIGSCQDVPNPWQNHGTREELQGTSTLHGADPGGPICPFGSCQDIPRLWQGHGMREEPAGSSSPQGCPGGPVCPFFLSVLLLLGFLLILGNVTYSDQDFSLEKSEPI